MIAHLRGREEALEPFGWSQEDTEWVAMVCLNRALLHGSGRRWNSPFPKR